MLQRTSIRLLFTEVTQRASKKIEQFRNSVLRLSDQFDQLDKIGREGNTRIILSQAVIGLAQLCLAQRMQLALPAPAELDLAFKEQVQPSSEAALRITRPLRDRLQLAMLIGQPRNDQTRFGELRFPEQDGSSGVQGWLMVDGC